MKNKFGKLSAVFCLIVTLVLAIVPMFAISASAAEQSATISFASTAQRVSQDSNKQVWANGGITFTNNKAGSSNAVVSNVAPVRLYANSSITIEAPAGSKISMIVFACNSTTYATDLKNSIGDAATVNSKTVTYTHRASDNTVTVTLKKQVRLDSLTVTYTVVESACDHAKTTDSITKATCTVDGSKTSTCDSCGEIVSTETFKATGHTYVDGVCSACGEAEPAGYTLVTSASSLKVGDKIVIVAKDYDFAMSTTQNNNNRGQASVTKDGTIVTFGADVLILTLEAGNVDGSFAFNTGDGYLCAASSSSNYLRTETTLSNNSSWEISISNDAATITAQGTYTRKVMQYNQSSSIFACYASATQKAISIYKLAEATDAPVCEHTDTTETTEAATCTTNGLKTTICESCGETVKTEDIPALGHNYVNRVCTVCYDELPVTPDYSGRYFIATKRTSGNYFWMTSDLGTATTKRYQAIDSELTELPESKVAIDGYVFVFVKDNNDNTYYIYAEGVEGNNYLGYTAVKSGNLVSQDKATKFTLAVTEEGLFNVIHDGNYLSLNGTTGNDYFAMYAGTQKQDLSLIPVKEECQHSETTTETVTATCTVDGSTTVTCNACGEIVSSEKNPATGHNYSESVTKPTCTDKGYTTYTCATCGDTYTDNEVPATGHNYSESVTKPTCTDKGYTTHTCANCGDTYTDNEVPATGHNYSESVTKPTCTEKGSTTYTCACGDTYTEAIDETGHNWENGVCTNCGEKEPVTETTITNASVNAGADLSLLYYVQLADGKTISNFTMKFVVNGKETVVTATEKNGEYVFALTGIAPQQMADNVEAYLYEGETLVDSVTNYSIQAYAYDLYSSAAATDAIKAFLYTMLKYGQAAQDYTGYNTNAIIIPEDWVSPEVDAFEGNDDYKNTAESEEYKGIYISAAGVNYDYTNRIYIKIKTDATFAGEFTVKIGDTEATVEALGNGQYIVYTDAISATEFDNVVTFTLCVDGENYQIVTYSVNAYAAAKWNAANEKTMALAQTLYYYGKTAEALK